MSIDRTRRITFEEVADLYNESRPSYPNELIEDIIQLSNLKSDGQILEVGCGPGNATILFAQKGYKLLGIELGERLAQFARQRCASFPNTTILHSAFEEYDVSSHSFDLAFSAEAFHWIPPEIGYPKLMNSLKETGSIALFWNLDIDPQTDWSAKIDKLFQKIARQFDNPLKSYTLEWLTDIIKQNFREHCGIDNVTVKSYNWSETISSDTYIKRMRTYSSHREMSETVRSKLYAEITKVINDLGGHIEKPMQTALFHASMPRE